MWRVTNRQAGVFNHATTTLCQLLPYWLLTSADRSCRSLLIIIISSLCLVTCTVLSTAYSHSTEHCSCGERSTFFITLVSLGLNACLFLQHRFSPLACSHFVVLYTVHSSSHDRECTVYSILYIQYSKYCTMDCTVHCIQCNILWLGWIKKVGVWELNLLLNL